MERSERPEDMVPPGSLDDAAAHLERIRDMRNREDPRLSDPEKERPEDMANDLLRDESGPVDPGVAESVREGLREALPLREPEGPTLLERVRLERDEAEDRARQAEMVVAALVRKYGERVHRDVPVWRVALTEEELTSVSAGILRVMAEPMSGAVLIRYERPL